MGITTGSKKEKVGKLAHARVIELKTKFIIQPCLQLHLLAFGAVESRVSTCYFLQVLFVFPLSLYLILSQRKTNFPLSYPQFLSIPEGWTKHLFSQENEAMTQIQDNHSVFIPKTLTVCPIQAFLLAHPGFCFLAS